MLQNHWRKLARIHSSIWNYVKISIILSTSNVFIPCFHSFYFSEKAKTAKEEARDLQLREEACIREKVTGIQKNLSLMLKALGEMALANPVFTHSQLPSLVSSSIFYSTLRNTLNIRTFVFETSTNTSAPCLSTRFTWKLALRAPLYHMHLPFVPSFSLLFLIMIKFCLHCCALFWSCWMKRNVNF